MLLGPSVALTGEGTGAGSYADKFNMQSITVPTIAFAAAVVSSRASMHLNHHQWPFTNPFFQAHHALIADSKFTWTSSTTGFNYLNFYGMVIRTILGWSQIDRTQLIQWWNRYVLSRVVLTLPPMTYFAPQLSAVTSPRMFSYNLLTRKPLAWLHSWAHASTTRRGNLTPIISYTSFPASIFIPRSCTILLVTKFIGLSLCILTGCDI